MKLIQRYRALSFEQKIELKTVVGLCGSATLACAKLVIGIFTDYNLAVIAVYTFALLLAKLQCLLGIRTQKRTFKQRTVLVASFLLAASVLYIAFMSSMFFVERKIKNNGMIYVLILALISFCELGFALAGVLRTKRSHHYYRNIKIINLCMALIAILTTQMAILNMQSQTGVVSVFNAYTGIGVGCFIALCALFILVAPRASVVGREHNEFVLRNAQLNSLVDMHRPQVQLTLCRSRVYGDYVYRASVVGDRLAGDIERTPSLWRRMHLTLKILCCVLSEILLFVWLGGRLVLFLRSVDLPGRLEKLLLSNGFVRTAERPAVTAGDGQLPAETP